MAGIKFRDVDVRSGPDASALERSGDFKLVGKCHARGVSSSTLAKALKVRSVSRKIPVLRGRRVR